MFAERLNFIMGLTGTPASALGQASSLDASHVSRLRSGGRALPKRPSFLPAMSAYLAKRVSAEYQRSSMCDILKLPSWPQDEAQAARHIEMWLAGETERSVDVEPILSSLASTAVPELPLSVQASPLPEAKSFYYGSGGRREAVLQLLDLILRERTPQTLLLSSEEDMGWMLEDPAFTARLVADFTRVLRAGNRIKIIHNNIGKGLNVLLETASRWVPVYMTGMIEPYYYPKPRDGVSRRTLFIAPKTAAVAASSVSGRTDGMLNQLITEKNAVDALSLEFENYFSLCLPLMKILTAHESDELWQEWDRLAREGGDLICLCGMPTLATMPEWVAKAMQARAPKSRILELRNIGVRSLKRLLAKNRYTELVPGSIGAAGMVLPCADYMGAPGMCYTKEELEAHRRNTEVLAAVNPNFSLISRGDIPPNLLIYGKQEHGAIVAKNDFTAAAFCISEEKLTNAFWDYLSAEK